MAGAKKLGPYRDNKQEYGAGRVRIRAWWMWGRGGTWWLRGTERRVGRRI